MVERIAAGKIRVPRFQRAFVWKQADLHALLDSILRGFPIGSILVWDTEEDIESSERIGPIEITSNPGGVVGYLLDGQQRVSTLIGTLRLTEDNEHTVDEVDWRVFCNLETLEFHRAPRPADRLGPQHFPVSSLLNTVGFFESCRRIQSEVDDADQRQRLLDEADRLASAFRDYQLPLIHIREADLDSAVAVFARLNRTGRKMAADEMVSALTYQRGQFHLAQKLNEFKAELEKERFGNLDRVFLLRAVLAALGRDIYAKDWADLMVKTEVRDKLPDAFESATEGIRRALAYLKHCGVTSDRLLPYGLQLVMLGEFFRQCPQPPANVAELLDRWFWVTSFTGWFGGVNTAQAELALGEMRRLAIGTGVGFSVVDLEAPAQPFPERFDGRSARVRAFLLYLASLKPRSLLEDEDLDPGELLSILGTRAVGYVLSNFPGRRDLVRSPANRMFLDRVHVGQAFGALRTTKDDRLMRILRSHGFPFDSLQRLRSDDRTGLIESRLQALINGERDFMNGRNVTLPSEQTAATIADSDVSDDEYSDLEIGDSGAASG
ncbi:MAG: DUF262 domain-containing protein [Spirochaetaceae bacterium]|nr:DUF262 domain-containing protein [Spirochaetaceae bacterium]